MKMRRTLPDSPEDIDDIDVLKEAIFTLKELEKEDGYPYVFWDILQRMLGGTCYAIPACAKPANNKSSIVLDIYDQAYFEDRVNELEASHTQS
jgi:hypothetical protein